MVGNVMTEEEARAWIGKEICLHWEEPGLPLDDAFATHVRDGGMIGLVHEVADFGSGLELTVDYGYGAPLSLITQFHRPDECPNIKESS